MCGHVFMHSWLRRARAVLHVPPLDTVLPPHAHPAMSTPSNTTTATPSFTEHYPGACSEQYDHTEIEDLEDLDEDDDAHRVDMCG